VCGYIRRVTDNAYVKALLISVGLEDLVAEFKSEAGKIEHFYPAFGGDPTKVIKKLLIHEGGSVKVIDATWWFDCTTEGDTLRVGERTTFNARNLDSSFWRGALKHHRALVVATGLGESQAVSGKKQHYLMEADQGAFLLGALYRKFSNGKYCCAVITRPALETFAQYHEKAMPLFIPAEKSAVAEWLNPDVEQSQRLQELLNRPVIAADLTVTPVKSFKSGTANGEPGVITATTEQT